jgi:hypothetical protein
MFRVKDSYLLGCNSPGELFAACSELKIAIFWDVTRLENCVCSMFRVKDRAKLETTKNQAVLAYFLALKMETVYVLQKYL